MKRLYRVLFFLVLSVKGSSQALESQPHGTLIVTVILPDGILMASDSRLAFFTTDSPPVTIAYLERFKKLFRVGNFQMGLNGLSNFNDKFIDVIAAEYNRKRKPNKDIVETFKDFKNFLVEQLKVPDSSIRKAKFMLAGYEGLKPVIIGTNLGGSDISAKASSLFMRMYSNDDFMPFFRSYNFDGLKEISCKSISFVLDTLFTEYAKQTNNLMVGGPLYMIQIHPDNKITELRSFPFRAFKLFSDLQQSILNNKVKLEYVYPWAEKFLKESIRLNSKSYNHK